MKTTKSRLLFPVMLISSLKLAIIVLIRFCCTVVLKFSWSDYLPKKPQTKVLLNCSFLSQSVILQMLNLISWFLDAERKVYKTLGRSMTVCPGHSSLPVTVASPLPFECVRPLSFENHFPEKSPSRFFKILNAA